MPCGIPFHASHCPVFVRRFACYFAYFNLVLRDVEPFEIIAVPPTEQEIIHQFMQ
jgi:hypothetical protein